MKHPSINIWIITIFIFTVTVSILHFNRGSIRRLLLKKPIEVAFAHQSPDSDAVVKVVLLCSSHGKEALSDASTLNEVASINEDGINYDFVKITRSIATLEDYALNEALLKEIELYDPTYVVIQESISFFNRSRTLYMMGLKNDIQFSKHLKALSNEAFYLKMMSNTTNKDHQPVDSTVWLNRNMLPEKQLRPDDGLLSKFIQAFNRKAIILHIPLPGPIEADLDSARNTLAYRNIFSKEQALSNFTIFWFKNDMPYRYYYDRAHMNHTGETIYTRWFVNELHQFHLSQLNND